MLDHWEFTSESEVGEKRWTLEPTLDITFIILNTWAYITYIICKALLAFKDLMVHGILQFTLSIAFRYVLHRCESWDIRCRESFIFRKRRGSPARTANWATGGAPFYLLFLGADCARVRFLVEGLVRVPAMGASTGGLTRPRRRPDVRTCSRVILLCKFRQWYFRRSTYRNFITTSPSSKW